MLDHAIIGCGRVAPNHVHGVLQLNNANLHWLCDRELEKAKRLAGYMSSVKITSNYRDILDDPLVSSVSLVVDHGHHYAIGMDVLRAGKHLLVEKPLCLSIEHGKEMIELAKYNNLYLTVVSQHRFDPIVRFLKSRIEEGTLGQILNVNASLQCARPVSYYRDSYWRGTWELEGGSVLINQGYHLVDTLRYLVGGVRRVHARLARQKFIDIIETEDNLVSLLEFQSGALGTLNICGAGREEWRSRIDLETEIGFISFDLNYPNQILHVNLPRQEQVLMNVFLQQYSAEPTDAPGLEYYGVTHRDQIADFAAAIREKRPCFIDPHDSLDTLRLILMIYASSKHELS